MAKVVPKYVARTNPNEQEHRSQLSDSINQALDIIGSVDTITLSTGTVRTSVSNSFINAQSAVNFTPLSAEAAAEKANLWIETVNPSTTTSIPSFDLRHSSTSTAVFTYNIAIIG